MPTEKTMGILESGTHVEQEAINGTDRSAGSVAGIDHVPVKNAFDGVQFDSDNETAQGSRCLDNARWVSMNRIEADPRQPRRQFSVKKLQELAESIRLRGVLQPIRVRESGDSYLIVAGERRYRASKMAGLKEIPAIVCDQSDLEAGIDSIIENLHRVDLNPMERADALVLLRENLGSPTWEEVGRRVGLCKRQVMHLIGLQALPEEIQIEIREGILTEKHGRALRMLMNENGLMYKLYIKIRDHQLTGDESIELARIMRGRNKKAIEMSAIRKTSARLLHILTVTDPVKWENEELLELRQLIQTLKEEVERTIRKNSRIPY
ncbi:ParB/RepB/Spo0J family partition protein [bacterium]|nr:ParB/RepB/Spo0J family partition protein [candidate division CSSED10-310 bacterium]